MLFHIAAPYSLLATLIIASFFTGCASYGKPNGQQVIEDVYTAAASTLQVYTPPSPSPVPIPTQTRIVIIPTSSPPPTATFPVAQVQPSSPPQPIPQIDPKTLPYLATRITFPAYATSTQVTDFIRPDKVQYYVLTAQMGQPLILKVDSPDQDVSLAVIAESGQVLLKPTERLIAWQTLIPTNQDFYILLLGGASIENYTLSVEIPARIDLPNLSGKNTDGWTRKGNSITYATQVKQGQTLEVALYASHGAVLGIYGLLDQKVYLPVNDNATLFSFESPLTQDYILTVKPTVELDVSYNLVAELK